MRQAFANQAYQLSLTFGRSVARLAGKIGLNLRPVLSRIEPLVLRFSARLAPGTVSVEGSKLYLGAAGTSRARNIEYCLGFERRTTQLFKQLIAAGDTVIDVGAHIGYYSLLAARLVGPAGRVYAFEPEPNNFALLATNVAANKQKQLTPVNKALGSTTGRASLNLDERSGWHSLHLAPSKVGTVIVDTTTLDDYFRGSPLGASLIKIDAQGAEAAVIQGARRLIGASPNLKMIIEWWPEGLEAAGQAPEGFFKTLQALGFRMSLIAETRTELIGVASYAELCTALHREGHTLNLLCERSPT